MDSTDLKAHARQRDELRGTTSITKKALVSIAQAATYLTLRVNPDDVSVSTFDDSGKLGLNVSTALRADDVLRCSVRPDHSLFTLLEQARDTIKRQAQTVSGHTIGRVNISIEGISEIKDERRVH